MLVPVPAFVYQCPYCNEHYPLGSGATFVQCPNCKNTSCCKKGYIKQKAGFYIAGACGALLLATITVLVDGIRHIWIGGFLLGIALIIQACRYVCIRTGNIYPAAIALPQ